VDVTATREIEAAGVLVVFFWGERGAWKEQTVGREFNDEQGEGASLKLRLHRFWLETLPKKSLGSWEWPIP